MLRKSTLLSPAIALFLVAISLSAADPAFPDKPIRKITPGKVIIPFEQMRRMWGELVSVDLETATGTFRNEGEDKLRAKTHGIGKGRVRVCWHVFLDDESLQKFRDEQIAVHDAFLAKEGAPGYVDRIEGAEMDLTMFQNGLSLVEKLKPQSKVVVVPAGNNLTAKGDGVSGSIINVASRGNVRALTVKLDHPADAFEVTGVARLRFAQ